LSAILHHGLGDGFSQRDIDVALKHMTPAEQSLFLDLSRLNKADHIAQRVRELEVRKELIDGVWRDVSGPMLLLRGIYEPGGLHEALTMTENYQWQSQGLLHKSPFPYKPYPPELLAGYNVPPERIGWDYMDWLMYYLVEQLKKAMAGKKPQLLIPKTREMLSSWLVCAFIFWHCEFWDGIGWIGQSEKDEKAMGLAKYINILYENQPDYLKARFPLARNRDTGTAHRVDWNHKSWFRAVPQGERQLAADHPHGYFNDESAHQPAWLATVGIAQPAVRQIISVSSAAMSDFGNACQQPGIQQ
jgi:hypothetical protein